MATIPSNVPRLVAPLLSGRLPRLESGDRLTRNEFERRSAAMPGVKAELIEGVVYMASPVSAAHGAAHARFIAWLVNYCSATPIVVAGDNTTVRLDLDNEPQPDALLRILPEHGGQTRISDNGLIEGAPELVAEIAISSASYDLHTKLSVYRRNKVQEYIVWRVWDAAIDWFVLRDERYELLEPTDGVYRSPRFAGLWLDSAAMLQGDLAKVMSVLQQGLASPGHRKFLDEVQQQRSTK
jgi:Uma2 family endonuclease